MSTNITFQENALYILLSNINVARAFHWGLYLHTASGDGIVHHLINGMEINFRKTWVYEAKRSDKVAGSKSLLLALQIADVHPDLHESLGELLTTVPIHDNSTCRIWVLEALQILDDHGYIKLTGTTTMVEREALREAELNRGSGTKTVHKSLSSSA
jgi:hypothetical protein